MTVPVRSSIGFSQLKTDRGILLEIENDRLRHIRLHERVNELPDPNYSTLKFFLGHLHRLSPDFPCFYKVLTMDRISQQSADNSMSNSNLSIVFGPTLFGLQAATNGGVMSDTSYQNLVTYFIHHFIEIVSLIPILFVPQGY